MADSAGPLGIIAGSGALPRRLVENCRAAGRPVFVLALQGEADEATVADVPHAWCRIGAAAKALDLLRANAVKDLVLAGGVIGGTAQYVLWAAAFGLEWVTPRLIHGARGRPLPGHRE